MIVCLVVDDDIRVVLKDGDLEVKGLDYICVVYIQVCKICIYVIYSCICEVDKIDFFLFGDVFLQIISEIFRVDRGRLIAIQGCLFEIVGDFWRMVWQERLQVIVMVIKVVEDDRVSVYFIVRNEMFFNYVKNFLVCIG